MDVVGKCPPDIDTLELLENSKFNSIELYLAREHLDNYGYTVGKCESSSLDIFSVHCPHMKHTSPEIYSDPRYFQRANDLAHYFDAYFTVHSAILPLDKLDEFDETISLTSTPAYENQPGDSPYYIEKMLFDQDRKNALDVSHFYRSVEPQNVYERFREFLSTHAEEISYLHLSDSTPYVDGVQFGEGDIDFTEMINIIEDLYSGTVVLEVMPYEQEEAYDFVSEYTRLNPV